MESLCKELVDTYNTNVLDNCKDKELIDEFMKVSEQHRNGDEGKKVLMNLIYNHFSPDMKKPEPLFIGGPETLSVHWSDTHKKIIYIFGEHHSSMMECDKLKKEDIGEKWDVPGAKRMSAEYFFGELIRTTDTFIDIFFEFPAMKMKSKEYSDGFVGFYKTYRINKIFEKFKDCVEYSKRSARKCKLSRVHYFDTRKYDSGKGDVVGTNIISWFRLYTFNITNTFYKEAWAGRFKFLFEKHECYTRMIKILGSFDDKLISQFLISQTLTENKYTEKELDKFDSDNPYFLLIISFMEEEYKDSINNYKLLWKKEGEIILKYLKPEKETPPTDEEFIKSYMNIYNSTVGVNAINSDIYLLSRLFKDFDLTKMEEKAYVGATDQPVRATNVIIYTGDRHAERYRKFLKEKLNFDQIAQSGLPKTDKKPIYCLDMKTIPQPLFSTWPPEFYIDKKVDIKKGFWKRIFGLK